MLMFRRVEPEDFFAALLHFDLETILHSDQIAAGRMEDSELGSMLRKLDIYPANAVLITIENAEEVAYLVRGENNPFFKALQEYRDTPKENKFLSYHGGYYLIQKRDVIEPLINAEGTLRATYQELELEGLGFNNPFLRVDTKHPGNFNPIPRKAVEMHFGRGRNLENYMGMLFEQGITEVRMNFVPPHTIKSILHRDYGSIKNPEVLVCSCIMGNIRADPEDYDVFDHKSGFLITGDTTTTWRDAYFCGEPNEYAKAYTYIGGNLTPMDSQTGEFRRHLDLLMGDVSTSVKFMPTGFRLKIFDLQKSPEEMQKIPSETMGSLIRLREACLAKEREYNGQVPYNPLIDPFSR